MSKIIALLFLAGFMAVGSVAYSYSGPTITESEHGFQTENIVATRYLNPAMGQLIGLRYINPMYDYHSDGDQVLTFLENNGCGVLTGGGGPYSEYMLRCDGVTDKASASIKIKALLPALDKFIGRL